MDCVKLFSASLLSAMLLVSAGLVSAADAKQTKQYNLDAGSKAVVGIVGFGSACATVGTAGCLGFGTHLATQTLLKTASPFDKENVMRFLKGRTTCAMHRPIIHSGRAAIFASLAAGVYEVGYKLCLCGAYNRIVSPRPSEAPTSTSTINESSSSSQTGSTVA